MSALIYAAIVAMWAVVLVPMWLRRHDPAAEARALGDAVRVLRRRSPRAPADVQPQLSVDVVSPAVLRRRRVLGTLVAAAAAITLTSATGLFPVQFALVPVLLLTGYVWQLRRTLRREAVSRARGRAVALGRARVASRQAATSAALDRPEVRTVAPEVRTVPVPARVETVPVPSAPQGPRIDTWEPIPVPPPIYATKPIALAPPAAPATEDRRSDDARRRAVND